jgi:predicted acyltransferase
MPEKQEALPPPVKRPQEKTVRLDSLDAFRGMTIFGMLLVNNIALNTHTPPELMHAPWNQGLHFADLVFPWFLFIVGVSIPYAWASHWRKGWSRGRYIGKAFTRALTLLALGCLIDSSIARTPILDLDVLQMIGLSYFVAALLTMLLPSVPRLVIAFIFLIAHAAVLQHVGAPGLPPGTFLPNRNIIAYLNSHVLEHYHLAGIISVIPGSALVLIGTFVGDILRRERIAPQKRFLQVILLAVVLMIIGMVWNRTLPYNKPVWTGSYIVFCGGFGALVLGAFYGLLDIVPVLQRFRGWSMPLQVFGSNAIVAYVAPILTKLLILQVWVWPGTHVPLETAFLHEAQRRWGLIDGGWTYTLCYIGFWWLVLLVLYRRKVFVRV